MLIGWIVEDYNNDKYTKQLIESIRSSGIDPIVTNNIDKVINDLDKSKYYYYNGTVNSADKLVLAGFRTNIPNFDNYLYSKYSSVFGAEMFNKEYAIVSLSELSRNRFFYYGIFGREAVIFIRPDSGKKTFTGQKLDLLHFDTFFKDYELIKHDLMIVSGPKPITGEWRFVVSKDGIVGQSTYNYQGQITVIPSAPTRASEFVKNLIAFGYFPDKLMVIDVCESNREFSLLEINAFCTSGLYACNKERIVKEVLS